MQSVADKKSKLPFRCRMVCVSLVGGSLVLVLIYMIYYMGFISAESAMWAAAGVFILAAFYESFLLSLITRHMLSGLNGNSKES